MSKKYAVFCFGMLVVSGLLLTATVPAWSGMNVCGHTIVFEGTDNTEGVHLLPHNPSNGSYTVQLQDNAALNVTGKDAAVSLGPDGKVVLSTGSHIGSTPGESPSDSHAVSGVVLSGEDRGSSSGVNRVMMEKGSGIAVDASEAVFKGENQARVSGIGIDRAATAEVFMDGASVGVIQKIANTEDKTFYTHGIGMSGSEKATVSLQGGAQVKSDVTVTGKAGRVNAWGLISSHNKQVNLRFLSGSKIDATVKRSDDSPESSSDDDTDVQAVGVAVFDAETGADVLADGSLITADGSSTIAGQKVLAAGIQLAATGSDADVATMRVENGSQVAAVARGSKAFAVGGGIMAIPGVVKDGDMDVASGSSISATACSEGTGESTAAASVLAMKNVKDVNINIANAELLGTMRATAVNTGGGDAEANIGPEGEFGIAPVGVGAMDYDDATVQLDNAKVTVTAEATARSEGGDSKAVAGDFSVKRDDAHYCVTGLYMQRTEDSPAGRTRVDLQHTTIDVKATSEAATQSEANAVGIQLDKVCAQGDDPMLRLSNSAVRVSALATLSHQGSSESASSSSNAIGILALECSGPTSLVLSQSTVDVDVTGRDGNAAGICVSSDSESSDSDYTIDLNNNSRVSVAAHLGGGGNSDISSAILVEKAKAAIHIDGTSELHGEWAVRKYGDEESKESVAATVDNHGLIAGRLDVTTLHNFGSGTLQVALDSAETFAYDAGHAEQAFYFKTKTAELDAGTTFRFIPCKEVYKANAGKSIDYALLESEGPGSASWAQDTLALTGSPLLGLSWSGEYDDKLIAHIKFLSPAEAGLPGHVTGAFHAAMADMPSEFVFGTDPEGWAPNVSGAFLAGMSQTVGASHTNIGNRLGGLMGLNSGDEIVASGGLWYNASFTDADQDERDGVVGFNADTTGLSLGLDRQVGALTVGVAMTQGKSEAEADDNSSEMDMDDHLFSLYGSYDGGRWFGEAVLSAGMGNVDSVRRLGDATFTADYDSTSYNAMAKAGMKLSAAGWQVTPLLAVEYSFKDYDGYTESGGKDSGALEVDSQDYSVFNVGGGATLQRSWVKSWGVLTPEVSAMVRYDLKSDGILTTAKFVGGSTAFIANGADPAETSWDISTALTLASLEESAVSLRLGYDYAGREDFVAHSVSGKVRFEF